MGGLIGIIANDAARYSEFSACVTYLQAPEGSKLEWLIGGDWCGARNSLAKIVLDDPECEWLWFMDDDHVFAPEILLGLLVHDLPLVVPVCLTRTPPFQPVTYTEKVAENLYLPIPIADHPESGLVKLEAGGCAGMLIRREVLEAIEPPWFEYTDRSEDIVFCEKAKATGFDIHCDLAARLGHISTAAVWPAISDGKWVTGITIGRELNVFVPITERGEE